MTTTTPMRLAGDTGKPLTRRFPFTSTSLKALKVPAGRKDVWVYDSKTPHLAYRLLASGVSSFFWYRFLDGKPVKKRIGGGNEITVERARDEAAILNGEKSKGVNPVKEQRRKRAEAELADFKLRQLWDLFIADKASTQKAATIAFRDLAGRLDGYVAAISGGQKLPRVWRVELFDALDRAEQLIVDAVHAGAMSTDPLWE
jgi:hypothetical protein